MKAFLLIVAMAATSAGAQIANPMPSDVDLKAAYCMATIRSQIADISGIAMLENDQRQAANNYLVDAKRSLERINMYLIPRMQFLEPSGLVLAAKSAEQDRGATTAFVGQCIANCGANSACYQSCMSQNAAGDRLASCKGATFLPF